MERKRPPAASELGPALDHFWELAAEKVRMIGQSEGPGQASPVFTVGGKYTARGWTEWTRGFRYGIPLLVFSATGDPKMLETGRQNTVERMANHLTHFGVHDHGFNTMSTYGNLLRSANRGEFDASPMEKEYYRLALRVSGSVQARRWTRVKDGGYIHSFNGPHSLFIDTLRTLRVLLATHRLGHRMLEENDVETNILDRAITHGLTTAKYAVFYGEGRDRYDVRGRVAHESLFNITDGNYRCPGTQQGYSGFSTWTRGLAWAMLGFTEFLEFLESEKKAPGGLRDPSSLREPETVFLKAARATCDFYMEHSAADGIPYWDTGAPELYRLGDWRSVPADPFNDYEPVDSSAAAIGAQALIRLGRYLEDREPDAAANYLGAGLSVLETLLSAPYLSTDPGHQGILLHSVYHRPMGWDHIPKERKIPCGESSMWGDYHMAELCYTARRLDLNDHYTFFENLV